jgi:putative hydrolase of the HAD superfamily
MVPSRVGAQRAPRRLSTSTVVDIALFDLDGVVRTFPDSAAWAGVWGEAFQPGLLDQVVTGKITDEEWRAEVLRRLGPDAADEVAAWSASCGEVNEAVLHVVRDVRHRARVGLLTNGTSRLVADLATLGIHDEFDVIFNSAELGFAKPDVVVYETVCARLGLHPGAVFFVDDSPAHVDGARDAGLNAALFVDALLLSDSLAAVGLLARD